MIIIKYCLIAILDLFRLKSELFTIKKAQEKKHAKEVKTFQKLYRNIKFHFARSLFLLYNQVLFQDISV